MGWGGGGGVGWGRGHGGLRSPQQKSLLKHYDVEITFTQGRIAVGNDMQILRKPCYVSLADVVYKGSILSPLHVSYVTMLMNTRWAY